ncbi:double-strand break repair helicase AddA [Phaeovulum vinaykumarii]|uniref:DNA 3'-5' helicase n=1 Tax=Phaeovulum vinaykumarii TaxID=407234 RepID=A0A1N7K981_9RHOB|nr:double-strand break repair helicase AddA [Phaeovulum vinaykumarii]SIS58139.1 DNA helicase/exodeoxyribonuclease V, subunit A [Phaeovulum vinaykumarii]SOB93694.1 DNA helicase/exodeoxyribonuclease V subunit A [Phaeovulum vinaykumarii]
MSPPRSPLRSTPRPAPDPASERQRQAAAPGLSTWVAANAGSGKTKVLTDRVARLLLGGTEPQKILCLTYTKAAAAEMQNRLLARLGEWAMLPDDALAAQLDRLGEVVVPAQLAQARRLFAQAIEAPGGLRIQTIHSFCGALLRRFPLEAGVSHDFVELDERSAALLRAQILEEIAEDRPDLIAGVAAFLGGDDFSALLAGIEAHRAAFAAPLSRDAALAQFGLPPGFDMPALLAEVFLGNEADLLDKLCAALDTGGASDTKAAARLRGLAIPAPETQAVLENVLLYGEKSKAPFTAKIGKFPTKATANGAAAPLMDALEGLMLRTEAARPRRLALLAATRAHALHALAGEYLARVAAHKAARGWLDFDDLIECAGRLLSHSSMAQWVLFRLDGGIDHILVDEAQDTSPAQWHVIERLAAEFTAGEGARGGERTLFVVGDRKQSIYSFQGADLRAFEAMRAHFADRFAQAARPMQGLELEYSFRSAPAVLRVVDLTFGPGAEAGLGGPTRHRAFFDASPGRVDLWPAIPAAAAAEDTDDWTTPIDRPESDHPEVVLAQSVAREIRRMIDAGTAIPTRDGPRPLHEGDVLILVRGRKGVLFAELIRACKQQGLAIAGADRLKLGAELAVRDITSTLKFLATPEDDLSLAEALRAPLFGLSESDLFTLARRPDADPPFSEARAGYLWQEMRRRGPAPALEILHDLRDAADFLRPYELIERLLTRHGGRARLLGRLGPEAEDGIDELVAQALAFESAEVPSLTGFLGWLAAEDVEVKRRPEGAGRAIRVMTVHGAKGLEAPVVILPDTRLRRAHAPGPVLGPVPGDPAPLWSLPNPDSPPEILARKAAEIALRAEEDQRLLYVAMTRAESWLIVAGARDTGPGSWYAAVEGAMAQAGATPASEPDHVMADMGPVLRLAEGDWPEPMSAEAAPSAPPVDLPGWVAARPDPAPAPPVVRSPSDLGGAKILPGITQGARDLDAALEHGSRVHALLEHLPDCPPAEWPALARALGAEAALPAAQAVLDLPEMAPFLAPEAIAEATIQADLPGLGPIHGAIDRLVVTGAEVLFLDYKTNAALSATPEAVPEGILRQMGAYHAALGRLHPGRVVRGFVLWTAGPRLMELPGALMQAALARAASP